MRTGRGIALGMGSVLCVSAAQLAMRAGMASLPPPANWLNGPQSISLDSLLMVLAGISGYAVSIACWVGALGILPLGRAYALLSLSYPLVFFAATLLFGESFSVLKSLGVALIVAGVLTIHSRRAPGARGLAREEL
ncbi:4-amino-4-deoxy-L-arabinose-phosphoundecaprenol flippase subunit ArnF [Pseudomonas sp. Marseille-QA0892]